MPFMEIASLDTCTQHVQRRPLWPVLLSSCLFLTTAVSCQTQPLEPSGTGHNQSNNSQVAGRYSNSKAPGKNQPRSLLLISVDTTRADHLEPYGSKTVKTPTLMAIAENGVMFEKAYAVAPLTLPTHTTINTGIYPDRHGVHNNGIHHAAPKLKTLAEYAKEAGFHTGAFVSAAVLDRRYGLNQGFDHYDDDLSTSRTRHPRVVPDRPAEATIASFLKWMENLDNDAPFFAWLHFYDPHANYNPPPPFRDTYRDSLYDGEIAYLDDQIGKLLKHPRLAPDGQHPVGLILLGDHGESLGEHGERTHGILAYDATLRIPFLMRLPGLPKGIVVHWPASQVDVLPTALSWLGIDAPAQGSVDGLDLFSHLRNRKPPPQREILSESHLPFYSYGWAKLNVTRHGSIKYIEAPEPEIYDLDRDPRELTNVVSADPGRQHDMERALSERAKVFAPVEADLALTADAIEDLQALGYVAGSTPVVDGPRANPMKMIGEHVALERARSLMRNKLFPQALKVLTQARAADPRNITILTEIVRALMILERYKEADTTLKEAQSYAPADLTLWAERAQLELITRNPKRALEAWDWILEKDPRHVHAHIGRAQILLMEDRILEAESQLAQTLKDFPNEARVLTHYAKWIDLRKGDTRAARDHLGTALALDPFHTQAWMLLGHIEEKEGNNEAAIASYREALQRKSDQPNAHARLGILLGHTPQVEAAVGHLLEAIRLYDQPQPQLHLALGSLLAENARNEEAQKHYKKVLEIQPKNPGARNNLAIAQYQTGDRKGAEKSFQAILKDFPEHGDTHANMAAVALDQQEWDKAQKHAEKALARAPKNLEALNNLGVALDEQKKLTQAITTFKKALDIEPGYWQARLNLAVALRKKKELADAASELRRIVEEQPSAPDPHLELGRIYALMPSKNAEAKKHLNAYIRISPPNRPERADALNLLNEISTR